MCFPWVYKGSDFPVRIRQHLNDWMLGTEVNRDIQEKS